MILNGSTGLDIFLTELFQRYSGNVADVKKITSALVDQNVIDRQEDIVNDHVAFRTLGVPNLGIQSFEKLFLHYGYKKMDPYFFEKKKLDAYWYAPPSPAYPRIFLSELRVEDLSEKTQALIQKYTQKVAQDPVDLLDLNDGHAIAKYLHQPLWDLPTKKDYEALLQESEYAAWVIYNRYYLNHYTISVHSLKEGYNTLPEFNAFVQSIGVKLNDAGGIIKKSKDGLLTQSSSVAKMNEVTFACGEKLNIAGSYVEFAERSPLPQFADIPNRLLLREQRRDGFEAANADKIFESTYTDQTE